MTRREWRVVAAFIPLAFLLSWLGCWALDAAYLASQAPRPPRRVVIHVVHHGSLREYQRIEPLTRED